MIWGRRKTADPFTSLELKIDALIRLTALLLARDRGVGDRWPSFGKSAYRPNGSRTW